MFTKLFNCSSKSCNVVIPTLSPLKLPIFTSVFNDEILMKKEYALYVLNNVQSTIKKKLQFNDSVFPFETNMNMRELCVHMNTFMKNMVSPAVNSCQNLGYLQVALHKRINCVFKEWNYKFTFSYDFIYMGTQRVIKYEEGIVKCRKIPICLEDKLYHDNDSKDNEYEIEDTLREHYQECSDIYEFNIQLTETLFKNFIILLTGSDSANKIKSKYYKSDAFQTFALYIKYSKTLNLHTIQGFLTAEYDSYFNMEWIRCGYNDPKFTVGYTNKTILESFKAWSLRSLSPSIPLFNGLNSLTLFSSGPLLFDQLGRPLTVSGRICLMTHLSTSTCEKTALVFASKESYCLYTITVEFDLLKHLMPIQSMASFIMTPQYEILLPLGTILEFKNETEKNGLRCINLALVEYDMKLIDNLIGLFVKYPRVKPSTGGSPSEIPRCSKEDARVDVNKYMTFMNLSDIHKLFTTTIQHGGIKRKKSIHFYILNPISGKVVLDTPKRRNEIIKSGKTPIQLNPNEYSINPTTGKPSKIKDKTRRRI